MFARVTVSLLSAKQWVTQVDAQGLEGHTDPIWVHRRPTQTLGPPKKENNMKKSTKGAVAAGAAVVLLLGGLGSYALWQDTESVGGGTINSGELNFAPVGGSGVWTETSVTPNTVIGADPAGFLIVPGDVLEYSTGYTVNWAGDNLLASITADFTAVGGDPALAAALDTQVSVNGGALLPNGSAVPLPLTASPQTITVEVTITFDITTTDLIAQNETVDLNAFTLTLDQVRP